MRQALAGIWLTAGTLLSSQLVMATAIAQTTASEDLLKMQENSANVVMPTIMYDNQRYSKLNQITAQNVGKLQVAWTFSTGVLRGHEGAATGDRRCHVRARAVPQYGIRARSGP